MNRRRVAALRVLIARAQAEIAHEVAREGVTVMPARGVGFVVLPAPTLAAAAEEMASWEGA